MTPYVLTQANSISEQSDVITPANRQTVLQPYHSPYTRDATNSRLRIDKLTRNISGDKIDRERTCGGGNERCCIRDGTYSRNDV